MQDPSLHNAIEKTQWTDLGQTVSQNTYDRKQPTISDAVVAPESITIEYCTVKYVFKLRLSYNFITT